MKLKEALDQIYELAEQDVIFAKRPWHMEAEALISRFNDNSGVPESIAADGFVYFLETHVAREVLEVFRSKEPSEYERRNLLLYYAEYDAYPDWVYKR